MGRTTGLHGHIGLSPALTRMKRRVILKVLCALFWASKEEMMQRLDPAWKVAIERRTRKRLWLTFAVIVYVLVHIGLFIYAIGVQ
jgi:type VI protein secretion system component VasF